MKNPMMQKVTLALSCAAVGLAVFDMTVKDARIHELTEERDIYASRFQNWSERAMRDEEAISERDDLLDKLLGEMDAVLNGEIKFEDAVNFTALHTAQKIFRMSVEREQESRPAGSRSRRT